MATVGLSAKVHPGSRTGTCSIWTVTRFAGATYSGPSEAGKAFVWSVATCAKQGGRWDRGRGRAWKTQVNKSVGSVPG